MTRSCAKPTCSSLAVNWFDVSREACVVTRSASETGQGIALCRAHAERFSVPAGWSLVVVDAVISQPELIEPAIIAEPADVAAAVSGDRPTEAVAEEAVTEDAVVQDDIATEEPADAEILETDLVEAEIVEAARADKANREHDRENPWFVPATHVDDDGDDSQSYLANPNEGSLLHRAFNGPATSGAEHDGGCADGAESPVDELSPRRRARSTSDDPEEEASALYREFELPFPPHARRVAVS